VIGIPALPGYSPLLGVERELRALSSFFQYPNQHSSLILRDEQATKSAVLSALPEFSWVHVACRSMIDRMDPGNSSLLLWDGHLTVAELASLRLGSAELAYLSSDCTAAAGNPRLPVEFTSLAASLQLAGYRNVIATLWGVGDRVAARVATRIYESLAEDDRRASEAVHQAVNEVRAIHPSDPRHWAAYVHVGP
jgi:CHAT domain-containing protein